MKRDGAIIAGAIVVIGGLAWIYLLWLAAEDGMAPGMAMDAMSIGQASPWSPGRFAVLFVMWAVMMIAMMAPSVAPVILLYARVGRQAADTGRPFASTAWFGGGYLAAWTGFALAAAAVQSAIAAGMFADPLLREWQGALGGAVLVAAGLYQWTPFKDACLAQCRAPLAFVQRHGGFRPEAWGAWRLGVLHGFYCVGCCWALMAVLFAVGVMNLLWVTLLAAIVLAEKLLPFGHLFARAAGMGLVVLGAVAIAG